MSAQERCPACGSGVRDRSSKIADREYGVSFVAEYARCAACGTLFQTPMPDVETLARFYPATYHSFAADGLLARMKHGTRLRRLMALLPRPDGIILDFGCGHGGFIEYAVQRHQELTFWGYEIASVKRKDVLADGRVTILHGSFEDLLAELPMCDLITMNHVIEHLSDPLAALNGLVGKLNDCGVIEGQTPAADSLEHRVFGAAWSGYHAPRHTVVFSRRGLEASLTAAGLKAPCVSAAFNPAGIAVSLAASAHGNRRGSIRREGPAWLGFVALATALSPLDLLSGSPGIVNFCAVKAAA